MISHYVLSFQTYELLSNDRIMCLIYLCGRCWFELMDTAIMWFFSYVSITVTEGGVMNSLTSRILWQCSLLLASSPSAQPLTRTVVFQSASHALIVFNNPCPFLTSLLKYHHQYIHTLEFSRGQSLYFIHLISCQDWDGCQGQGKAYGCLTWEIQKRQIVISYCCQHFIWHTCSV